MQDVSRWSLDPSLALLPFDVRSDLMSFARPHAPRNIKIENGEISVSRCGLASRPHWMVGWVSNRSSALQSFAEEKRLTDDADNNRQTGA
jgi:hypothetical protein